MNDIDIYEFVLKTIASCAAHWQHCSVFKTAYLKCKVFEFDLICEKKNAFQFDRVCYRYYENYEPLPKRKFVFYFWDWIIPAKQHC